MCTTDICGAQLLDGAHKVGDMLHHLLAATSSQVKCTSGVCTTLETALCRMLPAVLAPFCTLRQWSQLSKGAQLCHGCTLCPAKQPALP